MTNNQFKRSPVTKMLAVEIIRTTHALPKSDDKYEPQMYLSPCGRTVGKVMFCGTAVEKEQVGNDQPVWRLRISDPSGTIQVYAGQYQQEALQAIVQLNIPCFVSVVGKINIYEPEDGSRIVNIRPDSVTEIDLKNRDDFILDASLSTIRAIRKIPDEKMNEMATIYGENGKDAYILVARQAIDSLNKDYKGGGNRLATGSAPPETPPSNSYEIILEIINDKKSIKYEDLPGLLKSKGIDPNKINWKACIQDIKDKGDCFEPKPGVLRSVV